MSSPPKSQPVSYNTLLCTQRTQKLLHVDFWPHCINPWATEIKDVHFYRFDTLLPRVNTWLQEHLSVNLLKCETVEKKISSLELLANQSPTFERNVEASDDDKVDQTIYLKGLRIWYQKRTERRKYAMQIGYRNCLPECLSMGFIYPKYEDLGSLYTKMNHDVLERPLEGNVITVEMVSIRLDSSVWEGPEVEADKCHWFMSDKQHLFLFARIFYLFQCPAYEQMGAADFVPDLVTTNSESLQYSDLTTVNKKINTWLKQVKDIRICNIQTLPTLVDNTSDKVNASMNFLPNCHSCSLVHFIRVTYVRPKYGLPPNGLYIPSTISMKTFFPFQSSGKSEPHLAVWDRMQTWLNYIDNEILCIETFYHPTFDCNPTDSCKLLTPSEWTMHKITTDTGEVIKTRDPTPQAQVIRIYFFGVFEEPLLEVDELLEQSEVEEYEEDT